MPKLCDKPEDVGALALRRALAAVCRRLGLIGKVSPKDSDLCKIALEYANYGRGVSIAADNGQMQDFKSCLAAPNKKLDSSIPF